MLGFSQVILKWDSTFISFDKVQVRFRFWRGRGLRFSIERIKHQTKSKLVQLLRLDEQFSRNIGFGNAVLSQASKYLFEHRSEERRVGKEYRDRKTRDEQQNKI